MSSTAMQRSDQPPAVRLLKPGDMLERMQASFDAIARRAFEIFERNGMQPGHDLENWFQAETELFHPVHVEVAEEDRMLTVKAEVPGFSEKDLQLSLEPQRLMITGKRQSRQEKKTKHTLHTEQCSNEIFRIVGLPKAVDPSAPGVKATYEQGVLTVTMPEAPAAKRREIKLESKSRTA